MAQEGRTTPLTDNERLIIQNIFDTQPARREAYLKQLGFEMNPKDDNQYKTLGSEDGRWSEVDPGISAYFRKGGLKEVWNDVKDIGGDVAIKAPAIFGGAAAGASAGSAVGASVGAAAGMPHVGAGILAMTGAVTGGAMGSAVAEEVKKAAGDMILDKSVPQDRQLEAVQALMDGTFNFAFNGGAALSKAMIRQQVESRQKAILEHIGNGANHEVLLRVANEPNLFSPDAAKKGVAGLTKIYRDLFGLEDPLLVKRPDQIREGVFRQKIQPLNDAAEAEIQRLGADRSKDFTVEELTSPLRKKIYEITNGKMNSAMTAEEEKGVAYMQDLIKKIESETGVTKQPSSVILDASGNPYQPVANKASQQRVSFKDAYDITKKVQSDAFDLEVPGSSFLKQLSGGDENGLLNAIQSKGSQTLNDINTQQSRVMKAYKSAAQNLSPANIQNAFLSTNKNNVSKQLVRESAAEMDQVIGTKYSQAIENGSIQSWVDDLYTNSRKGGSSSTNAAIVNGAISGSVKGGLTGAAVGKATGAGAIPGAAVGAVAGGALGAREAAMLANPTTAIKAYAAGARKLATPVDPLFEALQNSSLASAEAAALTSPDMKKDLPETQAQQDPWSILDNPAPTQPAQAQEDPWAILDQGP